MKKFKLSKKNYLLGFLIVTGVLALVRIIRPDVAGTHYSDQIDHSSLAAADSIGDEMVASNDGGVAETKESDATRLLASSDIPFALTNFFNPDGSERRTRVRGVGSYRECFPDSQMVQLQAAERHGVSAVLDRADAEKRKGELVYVGSNPYYDVRKLSRSVPYLVPRASVLLQDIACNFLDSLQVKGIPMNKLIISSLLRTKEDVVALRRYNHNATENSCHLYGTTFDIAYNHYAPVTRPVRDDTLKWVLSEVLSDMRKQGRCFVKHENKQGCFHITVN